MPGTYKSMHAGWILFFRRSPRKWGHLLTTVLKNAKMKVCFTDTSTLVFYFPKHKNKNVYDAYTFRTVMDWME